MTEKSLTNKQETFLKSIFKFSISNWVNFIISLFAAVITTRVFTPDIYGTMNIFNTTSATIMSLMCLGLDSSYIRYYNEPPSGNNTKQLLFKVILIPVFLTIFTGIIITIFFYRPFSEIVFGRISWFISVMLFISVLSNILLRFLNITYRMNFNVLQYTIQSILLQFFSKIFILIAALCNPTAEIVITFNVVGVFVLAVVYCFVQCKDLIPEKIDLNLNGYKPVIKYGILTAPLFIGINFNTFMSQQIIAQTINLSAVGIYSSASYFATILSVLQGGFNTYWSAFMFANYNKEKERILSVHDYIMFFLIIVFIGMVVFKDLIYLLIGSQYHESKTFFALVLVYPILAIASETTSYGLSIEKKNHISLINYIISITINLTISSILIKFIGLIGAAVATCISGIILFALNTYWGQKYYISIRNIKKTAISIVLIIAIAVSTTFIKTIIVFYICIMIILSISVALYLTETKYIITTILNIIKRNKIY